MCNCKLRNNNSPSEFTCLYERHFFLILKLRGHGLQYHCIYETLTTYYLFINNPSNIIKGKKTILLQKLRPLPYVKFQPTFSTPSNYWVTTSVEWTVSNTQQLEIVWTLNWNNFQNSLKLTNPSRSKPLPFDRKGNHFRDLPQEMAPLSRTYTRNTIFFHGSVWEGVFWQALLKPKMTVFSTLFYTSTCEIPTLFIYLHPEKDTPFGWSLPI